MQLVCDKAAYYAQRKKLDEQTHKVSTSKSKARTPDSTRVINNCKEGTAKEDGSTDSGMHFMMWNDTNLGAKVVPKNELNSVGNLKLWPYVTKDGTTVVNDDDDSSNADGMSGNSEYDKLSIDSAVNEGLESDCDGFNSEDWSNMEIGRFQRSGVLLDEMLHELNEAQLENAFVPAENAYIFDNCVAREKYGIVNTPTMTRSIPLKNNYSNVDEPQHFLSCGYV